MGERNLGEHDVNDDAVGKLEALHDEEYQIQQVLADLVDNSVDANSNAIQVDFEQCTYPGEEKQYPFLDGDGYYILIKDNGDGVPKERIFKALSRGHRRDYNEWELGHFGVGLKDSSFSQAYEITLFTKEKDGDGEIGVMRYSSCAVKARTRDIHLTPDGMIDEFEWMKNTEGYENAMEYMNSINHGTAILLEGLHKIQNLTGTDDEASIVYVNRVKDCCENYLRLAFEYYIRDGGFKVPLSEPNPEDGEMYKHKFVEIEFNDEPLTPLDPFYRDSADETTNYGTLTWSGAIRTRVADSSGIIRGQDVGITIYLIPNKKNQDYLEQTEPVEESLQSALAVGAYSLQGLFLYRNGRLLDAAGKHPWKGIYKEIDNQKTHIRWEVHLPPGRSVGKAKLSEFRINKSKRDVHIEPRIEKELRKITGSRARQKWHPLDPDYLMGMGDRGRIRLNKDKGDKRNKERFGGCKISGCGDYRHKKDKHVCSSCGELGHELDCEPECSICHERGHEETLHQCSFCGEIGHEETCRESGDTPDEGGNFDGGGDSGPQLPPGQTTLLDFVTVNKVTTGLPINITYDEDTMKIDFNEDHHLFGKIMEKIRNLMPSDDD